MRRGWVWSTSVLGTASVLVALAGLAASATPANSSVRVAGPDQFGTSAAVSATEFPGPASAGAVVLARSGDAADSTSAVVLAAAKNAPLLFTTSTSLPAATAAELARVLPAGGTVYVLGGTAAVPDSIDIALVAEGYVVVRLAGADRYATSVAIATAVGGTGPVFLATGIGFADALAAGPAAASVGGVVLLTNGPYMPVPVSDYLATRVHAHQPTKVYGIGGPAAAAFYFVTPIAGADRYVTAAAVARTFFPAPVAVGVASGATFADALSGGAYLAHLGGPLLLSAPGALPAATAGYLAGVTPATALVFGGTAAISTTAAAQFDAALAK